MIDLFGNEEIRALSWKEPFATLMLHDKIETRTWSTKYRGKVLICASKNPYSRQKVFNISGVNDFRRIDGLMISNSWHNLLTLGTAIAIGNLVDCRLMTNKDENDCFVQYKEPWIEEKRQKDGTIKIVKKQLWCHVYKNVQAIEPFEWEGTQGWKTLDKNVIQKIKLTK